MNAQKLAFFIISFCIAGGIVNGSGIFDYQVDVIDVDTEEINQSFITSMDEIENMESESDLMAAFDGWKIIKTMLGTLKLALYVVFLPGAYLYNAGMNFAFAMGIQMIFNFSLMWGIIQMLTGRSTKGLD